MDLKSIDETLKKLYNPDHPMDNGWDVAVNRLLRENSEENKKPIGRSQDFGVAQLVGQGNKADYPEQIDRWEQLESEKPGVRGNCGACVDGTVWDSDTRMPAACPRCNGTGKETGS